MIDKTRFEPWVLGIALLLPTVVTVAYFRLFALAPEFVQQLVYVGGKVVQFALPVAWVLWVVGDRPRFSWGDRGSLVLGALFGLGVMLLTWFGYAWLADWPALQAALEPINEKVSQLGIDSKVRFAAVGVFYALGHSLLEEYYWRWFVFGRLRTLIGRWPAVLVSSVGFVLHHVVVLWSYFWHSPGILALLCGAILVGGIFWAWLYDRSGSLLGPWIGHLLVDAAIFAVGYQMVFA